MATMEKTQISDEWLIGATVGAYVILTFVLHFWGSAFMHFYCAGPPYPPSTDGSVLLLLIPGVIVVTVD